jgi:hypothetical protein
MKDYSNTSLHARAEKAKPRNAKFGIFRGVFQLTHYATPPEEK